MKKVATSGTAKVEFVETRHHVRRAYTGRVFRTDGGFSECGALDISAGGVGLLVTERLEVGDLIELAFLGCSIAVPGSVRHVTPLAGGDLRIGVAFHREEPELAEVALAAG
jgi:hypothetical protein